MVVVVVAAAEEVATREEEVAVDNVAVAVVGNTPVVEVVRRTSAAVAFRHRPAGDNAPAAAGRFTRLPVAEACVSLPVADCRRPFITLRHLLVPDRADSRESADRGRRASSTAVQTPSTRAMQAAVIPA